MRSKKASIVSVGVMAIAALLVEFLPIRTQGFTASLPRRRRITTSLNRRQHPGSDNLLLELGMAPLSSEEIFARAQQLKKDREEEAAPPPMLFDEDMLADMQAALLLLEERVQGGPGSLSVLQVDQLEAQLSKIMKEMKENEHLKPEKPAPTTAAAPSAAAAVSSQAPQQPATTTTTTTTANPTSSTTTAANNADTLSAAPRVIDIDTPSDEGATYSGRGGMGQAADTVNTYVIPGMDEMGPEEYRAALQQSVIDRQAKRKGSGVTGNRSSWDYLNSLTGETGVLKKEDKEEGEASPEKKFTPWSKKKEDDK